MTTKKILSVDDDKINLKVVEAALTKAGYSVVTAKDGEEAIDVARRELPDFILLDIRMPGMSGIQVGEALRSFPETKDIPICYLTSLLDKEEEQALKGRILGSFFLAKPVDPKLLLQEIAKRI